MALVRGRKAEVTLRYWKASLAWRIGGKWAEGFTQESFIQEVRMLCCDNDNVGSQSDRLLDDMIHGREHNPREIPGQLVYIISSLSQMTQVFSQRALQQELRTQAQA